MSCAQRGLRGAAAALARLSLSGAAPAARAAGAALPACGAGAAAARAAVPQLRRGFAADAGAGAAPLQAPPAEPWAADGTFLPAEVGAPDARPVFAAHAPYAPRAATPSVQGARAAQRVPLWRLDGTPVAAADGAAAESAAGGGGDVARVTLHGDVFDVPIRRDLVHRVVTWQLAKARAGTGCAKDRSEVSGTGKKPHAQKGTGRARAGTRRAPQHRGGGAAHGPRPRSFAIGLQRKVRRAGLCCTLSAKLAEGNLVIVDAAAPAAPKTGALAQQLAALCAARGEPPSDAPSLLIVDAEGDADTPGGAALRRAAANLPRVHVLPARGLNVYSILQQRTLVMTAAAAAEVTERLTRPIKR